MNPNDEKLSALLKRWRDIDPAGNFEANVLRRVRLAKPERRQSWLEGLLFRPSFVTAAVAISFLIGATGGVLTRSASQRAELEFMSPTTLAGGYARITTGAHR